MCCYTRGRDSCHLQDLTKDTHKGVRMGRQREARVLHILVRLFLSPEQDTLTCFYLLWTPPPKKKKIHQLPTYMCTKSTPLPSALFLTPVHRMLFLFSSPAPRPFFYLSTSQLIFLPLQNHDTLSSCYPIPLLLFLHLFFISHHTVAHPFVPSYVVHVSYLSNAKSMLLTRVSMRCTNHAFIIINHHHHPLLHPLSFFRPIWQAMVYGAAPIFQTSRTKQTFFL